MKLDKNARYRDTHEWARQEGDLIICGITDHAQDLLSDLVFVELPAVGSSFKEGDVFGVVESVKAASDLYMPMAGEITEVNAALEDRPEVINSDPYGDGWLIKFKPTAPTEWHKLLSPEAYEKSISA